MLISAVFLVFLVLLLHPVSLLLAGSRDVAEKENARTLLESCARKCREASVFGASSRLEVISLTKGRLASTGNRLVYTTREFNVSISPFRCAVDLNISRGKNMVVIHAPDPEMH